MPAVLHVALSALCLIPFLAFHRAETQVDPSLSIPKISKAQAEAKFATTVITLTIVPHLMPSAETYG
jgi:hypothetical protein